MAIAATSARDVRRAAGNPLAQAATPARPVGNTAPEIEGTPAGPPHCGASGLKVQPMQYAGHLVTRAQLNQILAALQLLPAADRALAARAGVEIELVPASGLEDGLLGATTIIEQTANGPWQPTKVRIAVASTRTGSEAIGEVVQHEMGHVIAVLRHQDRSEAAAIAYARNH